jgi:hypothetical protein
MTWANYRSCSTLNTLQKIVRELPQKGFAKPPNKSLKWKLKTKNQDFSFLKISPLTKIKWVHLVPKLKTTRPN